MLSMGAILVPIALGPTLLAAEPFPDPVGLWEFDDPSNLARATIGRDLVLVGSHEAIEGVIDGDGAARIGIGSHYRCEHGIPPGDGTRVGRYAIVIDFRIPALGSWYSFFQTNPTNAGDGDLFVRPDGALGVGDIGYPPKYIDAGVWYRLAIVADTDANLFSIYLDGERLLRSSPTFLRTRFTLDSVVLFFADDNGDDGPIDVSLVSIFDRPLAADEVSALGCAGPWDLANRPPEIVPEPAGPAEVETQIPYAFRFCAADPDGDRVRIRVDWGDRTLSEWSDLAAAGEPVIFEHVYNRTGELAILAQARDEHGRSSAWTLVQGIRVSGEIVVRFLTPPYFQDVRTDGITIMWELDLPVEAEAEYGPDLGYGRRAACEVIDTGAESAVYRARLEGLAPGTLHHVRPVIAGKPGEDRPFRTAPAGEAPFSFAVWGDSQGTNHLAFPLDPLEPTKAMMAHMAAQGIDLAVCVGDLAERGEFYEEVRTYYLDRVPPILGPVAPWYVAWGNHDGPRSAVLRLFADHPSRNRKGFDPGYGSYSFDYGGSHFVCIDYQTMRNDIPLWVEKDLQAALARDVRFTFVFVHVPPFTELWSDGDSFLREKLVPALVRYGVDICFSGHVHEYERGMLDGTVYVVTGGGSWLDIGEPLVRDWPHMTVGGFHPLAPGIDKGLVNEYVKVDVDGDRVTVRTYAFEPSGAPIGIVDEFEILRCGNGNGPADDRDGNGIADGCESRGQIPGDCDGDGALDIGDALCLLGHLFRRSPALLPCGDGTRKDPGNFLLLNANGDARLDIADAVYLARHLFGEGPPHVLGSACRPIEGCPARCRA